MKEWNKGETETGKRKEREKHTLIYIFHISLIPLLLLRADKKSVLPVGLHS
jgi:hypothetical protein